MELHKIVRICVLTFRKVSVKLSWKPVVKYDSLETLKTKNWKLQEINFNELTFLVSFIFTYFLSKLEMYYEQKCSTFWQYFCFRHLKLKPKDLVTWPSVLHNILLALARTQSFILEVINRNDGVII